MAYATRAQIEHAAGGPARLLELTDRDADGIEDAGVVDNAVARAEGWIHGFLRLRHTVPIVNPTAEGAQTLARLSAEEAVYILRSDRFVAPQHEIDRHKERDTELGMYRDGKLRVDEPLPGKSSAVGAKFVPNCSSMSRDGLKGAW